MPGELTGQVAVVTGAGRGFGKAIAEALAGAGAAVTVTSRTRSQLDETVASIEAAGGRAYATASDVTSREDVVRVKRETEEKLGPANIVIHNAGVPWPFGPVWHVDPDEWWEAQAVHVRGAFLYMNAFVPGMMERGGGRVIIVTSTAGRLVRPNLSGYAVAKNTQIRLVEHLAAEGREHNVFAWAVHPGSVLTGISDITMSSPDAQRYLPDFVGRLNQMKSDDPQKAIEGLRRCGELCVTLASGRADALSGQYLEPTWDLAQMVREAQTAVR
jgi:NAD(P)-dependent dehydrogenase (short-subunit alcohol dehydrogenase family)